MSKEFAKKDKRTELEKERDEAIKLLKGEIPGSDNYVAQLDIVERLDKLVAEEQKRKPHASPDTLVTGAVGLIQVGAILGRENLHNVTSKALNFVFKGRVR